MLYKFFSKFDQLRVKSMNYQYKEFGIVGKRTLFYPNSEVKNLQDRLKLRIGENTHIRGELFIYPYGEGLSIGDNCYVGSNSIIRSGNKIEIGDSVLIAHNVTIIDSDSHELDYKLREQSFKDLISYGHPKNAGRVCTASIVIKNNVWISYNVCILKGVTIGEGAVVGAGSVVTKDVPAWTLVAGNPAKVIKQIPH
jgi:acetyltransferase-like isoleucine patch superfamily enzyme